MSMGFINRNHSEAAGFTIVELLIVIVIIAILSAITLITYNGIQDRAKDAGADSNLSIIRKSLDMYKLDNGYYPPACGSDDVGCNFNNLSSYLVPVYISTFPSNYVLYQYARSSNMSGAYGYGVYMRYYSKTQCKTGLNVPGSWWGIPNC